MAQARPFDMPGYSWDGTRFYKDVAGPAKPAKKLDNSAGRQRKKARRAKEKGKAKAVESSVSSGLRTLFERDPRSNTAKLHQIERTLYPDCLPMGDDSICALCFDDLDPSLIRIGCAGGSIASGSLSRPQNPNVYAPNDENGWRTGWMMPSRITSLVTCGDRMLATCLGSPAQALVATTRDNISLASVTLSPRKTSLWTGALSESLVALGCDTKVLVSRDPSRAQMDGYTTGDKFGGGAVFALELVDQNLVYAGTRKGQIKMFDTRSSASASASTASETRPEVQFAIPSTSVTHLRLLKNAPGGAPNHGLLVAGMDGSLSIYDLRFVPPSEISSSSSSSARRRPLLALEGHSNTVSLDLGLDVWREDFVAAAGDDGRIRLWSLRALHGQPILPSSLLTPALTNIPSSALDFGFGGLPPPQPSPLLREFGEPVKALKFAGRDAAFGRAQRAVSRRWLERSDGLQGPDGGMDGSGPSLWIGDGPVVECFSLGWS